MQYISGPNSKYSWANQQETGEKNAKRSIGSIITVATAVVLNKKDSNVETKIENNENDFQACTTVTSSIQDVKNMKKSSQNILFKLNKRIKQKNKIQSTLKSLSILIIKII